MPVAIPNLGFGTAALALAPEDEARDTIKLALDKGIQYFDTAALYGGGQAEVRLGQALKDASDDILVSTKCGRFRDFGAPAPSESGQADVWDFSEAATRASIERSCERLFRERLDIVFLHDIEAAPDQAFAEALPVLREMQQAGRIGLVGAGCNTVNGLLNTIDADAADVLLVAGRWTLLDRTAGECLLPKAQANGSKVVAGGVLNSGCLARATTTGAKFDYRPISPREISELTNLTGLAAQHEIPLLAAALQFPSRDPRVDCTLLGASSSRQLQKTIDALAIEIPDPFWADAASVGLMQ